MARESRRTRLERELREQRAWIEKCGGDREGYIEHYGSADDEKHYGDGGEAIYKADTDHLHAIEAALREVQ